MNRNMATITLISFIYISSLIIGYLYYIKNEYREIEELKLSYAVDYCADAAVFGLLNSEDLCMDYIDKMNVKVNPKIALNTFIDMFCFNYNLEINEENRCMIKMNYIPAFAVATYDGFYVASPRLVRNDLPFPENKVINGDWDLVFDMKMPYIYTGTNGSKYSLNIGLEYYYGLNNNDLQKHYGIPYGSTIGECNEAINRNISDKMAYYIELNNENNYYWENKFYIPKELTSLSSINPINDISVIALVQNVDITTARKINAFSVGGAKVNYINPVVGYERNGKKYYAYIDKINENIAILDVFRTMEEAAENGYYYDVLLMK